MELSGLDLMEDDGKQMTFIELVSILQSLACVLNYAGRRHFFPAYHFDSAFHFESAYWASLSAIPSALIYSSVARDLFYATHFVMVPISPARLLWAAASFAATISAVSIPKLVKRYDLDGNGVPDMCSEAGGMATCVLSTGETIVYNVTRQAILAVDD
ncbi:hypothetical protein ANO11243_014490 [Dothideomycetidae sp. 11243]|nr:hypothetical protein ANO11243_014490 [fungal sp. No.11243]